VRADVLTWTNAASDGWAPYLAQLNSTINTEIIGFQNLPPIATVTAQAPAPQLSTAPTTTTVQAAVISNIPASITPAPAFTAGPPPSPPVAAYVNLGNGPYPNAALITTGGAQPWFNSSQISSFFGGQPTSQQQQSFDSTVLQRVQQTFAQSGVPITLTSNPNVPALHTISLVSNTGSASLPSAIGMTQVGGNGFSFIDQIAKSAQSLDQLEWVVAHNVSHELMLGLGVPENYDQSGTFVDSKLANWAMMVNPDATFSPAASQALLQAIRNQGPTASSQLGAQDLTTSITAAPEPATWALWALAALTAMVGRRVRRPRVAG
jgi:hypothetical protein